MAKCFICAAKTAGGLCGSCTVSLSKREGTQAIRWAVRKALRHREMHTPAPFNVWTDWKKHLPKTSLPVPYTWSFDEDWGEGGCPTVKLFKDDSRVGAVYEASGGYCSYMIEPKSTGPVRKTVKMAAKDLLDSLGIK